jgi:hypothetical protein
MDNSKELKMNGFLQWSKRTDAGKRTLSHADMYLYSVPFFLTAETAQCLGQLSAADAERKLRGLVWPALVARDTPGTVRGTSYGAVSHSIESIAYAPGDAGGRITVGQSIGIGD